MRHKNNLPYFFSFFGIWFILNRLNEVSFIMKIPENLNIKFIMVFAVALIAASALVYGFVDQPAAEGSSYVPAGNDTLMNESQMLNNLANGSDAQNVGVNSVSDQQGEVTNSVQAATIVENTTLIKEFYTVQEPYKVNVAYKAKVAYKVQSKKKYRTKVAYKVKKKVKKVKGKWIYKTVTKYKWVKKYRYTTAYKWVTKFKSVTKYRTVTKYRWVTPSEEWDPVEDPGENPDDQDPDDSDDDENTGDADFLS